MNVEAIAARDLSPDLARRWTEILQTSPELASPYFRPEYVHAASELRTGVEIGVIRDAGQIVGFFPFERCHGSVARPVGGKLCDYQAVIAPADAHWTVDAILSGCRLKAWEFDHQLASQQQLAPYFAATGASPLMDLSDGYEAYVEQRKSAARAMGESLRKLRKFQREHDVRFEWQTTDESVFQKLLVWKSQQYHRTGLADVFAVEWVVQFLRDIWQSQSPEFAGILSAVYANDQLAAVHFYMRSGRRLHSWFPAYDMAFAKYSPGVCQLLLMAQHAPDQGVDCIDLGKGKEDYKLMVATSSVALGEGFVETRPMATAMRSGWRRARDWVKQSPLEKPARVSLRWLQNVQHWMGANRD